MSFFIFHKFSGADEKSVNGPDSSDWEAAGAVESHFESGCLAALRHGDSAREGLV